MLRVILFLPALCIVCGGCNSISSTMLNRTDNDVFVGNSNGESNLCYGARPFKGVPITLRVPTHLDVRITEKIYLRKIGADLVRVQTKHRQLQVVPFVVETDKVFTVDPKRPAAGTLAATLTFGRNNTPTGPDNSQYFESIQDEIQDNTIKDTTLALQTLLPTLRNLGKAVAANEISATLAGQLVTEYRTVAWKRFDLDACDFEQQVTDFVSQHMNCCNSCEAYTNDNTFSLPADTSVPPQTVLNPQHVDGATPGTPAVQAPPANPTAPPVPPANPTKPVVPPPDPATPKRMQIPAPANDARSDGTPGTAHKTDRERQPAVGSMNFLPTARSSWVEWPRACSPLAVN